MRSWHYKPRHDEPGRRNRVSPVVLGACILTVGVLSYLFLIIVFNFNFGGGR